MSEEDRITTAELLRGVLHDLRGLAGVPGSIESLGKRVDDLATTRNFQVEEVRGMLKKHADETDENLEEFRRRMNDDFNRAADAHGARVRQEIQSVIQARQTEVAEAGERKGKASVLERLLVWLIPALVTLAGSTAAFFIARATAK